MTYPCTDAIMDMMAASGPQELVDLKRECRTQAVPYSPELFEDAMQKLVAAGKIVLVDNDGDPYYDFPESYYSAQIK
jgi:hypothetical protein